MTKVPVDRTEALLQRFTSRQAAERLKHSNDEAWLDRQRAAREKSERVNFRRYDESKFETDDNQSQLKDWIDEWIKGNAANEEQAARFRSIMYRKYGVKQ